MRMIPRPAVVLFGALTAGGLGRSLEAQPHVQPGRAPSVAPETSLFAPLALRPAPSETRLATGAPGPKYWQNRADYDLKVELKDEIARGAMVLRYTNNSPHPLTTVYIQVDRTPEVIDTIAQLVNGQHVVLGRLVPDVKDMPRDDLDALYGALLVQPTKGKARPAENAYPGGTLHLAAPLAPGATGTFYITWHFFAPPLSQPRRRASESPLPYDAHVVAQWFPRVAVYDDVTGWCTECFIQDRTAFDIIGNPETHPIEQNFLEYGDYTLAVTLPAKYIVAATGTLDNPGDVLPPAVQARLSAAAKSDTVVHVVTAADLMSGAARPKREGTLTWKFHAQNVRDMVWCASPRYQWDALGWNGKLVQAYYWSQGAGTAWPEAAAMARTALQEYSERWFPYPYPQLSAIQTKGGLGVEYPMLALGANFMNAEPLYDVLSHVVAHNWFPMLVGSNERTHPWMDEGFATFMSTFAYPLRYPEGDDQAGQVRRFFAQIEDVTHTNTGVLEAEGTDMTINVDTVMENRAYADYIKTAAGLQLLRREILGPEKFDKAVRTYIERWAYKHPTPADFFRTMADASGQQLDWFWREWFLSKTRFNQAIEAVTQTPQGGENHVSVTYVNRAPGVLPILARVTFSDGSTQDVSAPADVWRADPARYVASYTFPNKTVTRIELDPDHRLVDVDRSNNVWTGPGH